MVDSAYGYQEEDQSEPEEVEKNRGQDGGEKGVGDDESPREEDNRREKGDGAQKAGPWEERKRLQAGIRTDGTGSGVGRAIGRFAGVV